MFKKALLSSLVSAFLALSIFTVATAFGETTPSDTPPSGLASPTFGGLRVNGTSVFYGPVQIGDHLNPYSLMVTNGIDLYGDLNMRGGGSDVYTNSLYVSENIMNNVLGDPFPVYIYDDLTTAGKIITNNGLDVNTTILNAKAGLAVTGTTTSTGKITANGGLDVNNSALNAKAGLVVTGTTTSTGKITAN
ncbi:MAG TPA: hypothetical protein PK398_01525, partial [Candidatus Gracilibacteria bacterium]|nr:hypothetical protein [Candidatus Gracilibacteria bacterium]